MLIKFNDDYKQQKSAINVKTILQFHQQFVDREATITNMWVETLLA